MKILFFHRWIGVHSGGTETHVKELAFRLAKRGNKVHILTRGGRELKNTRQIRIWRVSKTLRESDFSYEDWRVYFFTLIFVIKALLKIIILKLKGIDFDVVSVHFTTEAFIMRFVRKIFGWPYVFILEGYTDAEAKEGKHADLQIAVSNDIAQRCKKKFGYKPIVIPNGIDLERFNKKKKNNDVRNRYVGDNCKLALTVCRLEPRKDVPTLIETAKILSGKNSKIKFVIVGDGIKREEIKQKIVEEKLENTIYLVFKVPDNRLPNYYKAADLFVLPTLYEGFGIVFLEAMASGLPIVSTTAKAVPEVVGDAGILVPPRRPDLLADRIQRVLKDKNHRRKLIVRGFDKVAKYSWDNLIVDYEKAYKSVIKAKHDKT